MNENLRRGWIEIITADDLDGHMVDVRQAEVNAKLASQMLKEVAIPNNGKLLVHGCGTGQIFDYIPAKLLEQYKFTFADLNPKYLEKLKNRLSEITHIQPEIVEDDIENSKLSENFDGVLAILLLEHINWRHGISSIQKLNPSVIYLIIQEQTEGSVAITVNQALRESIKLFAKTAMPKLVPRDELIAYLDDFGYTLTLIHEENVPNNKKMVGLTFKKQNDAK